jgi:selenocysteine-specific elongation factor
MEEVIALPGDRFVIRRPSPAETVGGGVVVDAFPPRRLNQPKLRARLEALSGCGLGRRIEILVDESAAGLSLTDLIRETGAGRMQIMAAIAGSSVIVQSTDDRLVTRKWIDGKRRALLSWLRDFHRQNPNAPGAPLAAARMGLDAGLAALIFKGLDVLRVQGETVSLASHKAEFTPQEVAALQKMEHAFRAAGFQPPSVAEAIAVAGMDSQKARALLEGLVKNNRLIRLPDDLIFHADVVAHIRNSLAQHKGRKFSVAEFKGWMSISRKFAIPLLEYLDQQKVTRREGEVRVVL